ncbi:Arginine biosynthesis bifunctional protein ArgJ, mitochondrial [Extremus antarcticus]|uniref:Arginine biosynthesis bifunctional protein ArgJ, mitochondrial n=1 Tax=Extremus antarcticus TaxID=702011 RepID=A0AAJ0GCG0_9PEZI|nr:Arginine biosynthesis bifunctional protein ArgJ, mitochondrial [Extremus antarcticus]
MAPGRVTTGRLLSAFTQIRHYSAPAERSIPAAKQKYVPTSGTYPKGFLAGSAHAGVKASNTKYDDIALVVSETPCPAAAVITRNVFKAAPIVESQKVLEKWNNQNIRGVIVNSGCANAVTGLKGAEDAVTMARTTDACFGESESSGGPASLVMSTGVIGQRLPIDRIEAAIPKAHASLGSTHEHWMRAAQAICTTDTFPKLLSRTFTLPSHPETEYSIAGMTKGAGMIHPNMDAAIAPEAMHAFLRMGVNKSFNSISIDGDTSTNDTVALFANGVAAPSGFEPIKFPGSPTRPESTSPDAAALITVMNDFLTDLAKLVVRDGEGATKFITIRVVSDVSIVVARRVAMSISTSTLLKTAIYGKDANWGRILCAIGYAPGIMENPGQDFRTGKLVQAKGGKIIHVPHKRPPVDINRLSLAFLPADGSEELKLFTRGEPENVDEARAKEILEMEDLEISVKLNDDGGAGESSSEQHELFEAVVWTCDLSHEYVTINGDYRT